MQAEDHGVTSLMCWKEKQNFSNQISIPDKKIFKVNEEEIKTFPDKQNPLEFIASQPYKKC